MLKNVIYQTIIHCFESPRKTRASWCHLLLQNDVCSKDVTNTCKRMWHSPNIGGISSVQWGKVGRSWSWVPILMSVSCTKINYLRYALVIWSSLQRTSKQWIITQQFTARADLFLKYTGLSHPILGMGPRPMRLWKLAAFWLKLGNMTSALCMMFPLLDWFQ